MSTSEICTVAIIAHAAPEPAAKVARRRTTGFAPEPAAKVARRQTTGFAPEPAAKVARRQAKAGAR